MKLTFFGAAKAVTGSCHCLEVRGKKILVDCGLQQGRDERDNSILDFSPSEIDYVIVTHAHIDHSGRIPLLVKKGFHGQIFTTRLTGEILSVMLQDSAHIQEMEAQWKNEKGKRTGREPVEPLYTVAEAVQTMAQVVTFEYDEIIEVIPGVKIRFVDAGHLLGSASVEVWASEEGVEKKIVFSGDIGNINQPVIRDPVFLKGADYVVMESTYGDRNHQPVPSYTAELAKIIDDTFAKGGNVIIPSFAVGRTQELLYFMREMKRDGLVKSDPDFAVVVDSPLANVATKIFSGDLRGYLDEEAIELVREGEQLFTFPGLTMTETSEESKLLN
ncbi:MAG: MBL fold metallo-hydrolase, partial [Ruminiclostridium sp.]|nr:MBL fold metallo-hydrolase [Ruminiclostridium sp.]